MALEALLSLREAAGAMDQAADLSVFDETVTAGVSANLCAALAAIAGPGSGRGFEVGFRWARAVPAEASARRVTFAPGTGALLRDVESRLRHLRLTGAASITGLIGTLFDDGHDDRFRVQVRGEVAMEEMAVARATGNRRLLWIRLPDRRTYDLAIAAHRAGRRIRAEGQLRTVNGRLEIVTGPGGLEQLAEIAPASDGE